MVAFLCAAASAAIAVALWVAGLDYDPTALALISAATVAAIAATAIARRQARSGDARRNEGRWSGAPRAAVALGLGWGLVSHLVFPPGGSANPLHAVLLRVAAATAAIVVATYALPPPRPALRRVRYAALIAVYVLMGAIALAATPDPRIDVFTLQQDGAAVLARGENPYEATYANPYSHEAFFGPGFIEDGRITAYPYLPPTALLGTASWSMTGDVRWAYLICVAVAAAALAFLGQSITTELVGVLVLFQPGSFLMLVLAWTEPLVLCTWICAVLATARAAERPGRSRWAAAGIAIGIFASTKQYAFLIGIPLVLAIRRQDVGRCLAWAGGVLALVMVPFLAWNAGQFVHDVVWAQVLQPFREDALSILALLFRLGLGKLPAATGFVAAAVALFLGSRRPLTFTSAVSLAPAAFLLLVLFNKQAFFNYYWLGVGLLATAVAVAEREEHRPGSSGAAQRA